MSKQYTPNELALRLDIIRGVSPNDFKECLKQAADIIDHHDELVGIAKEMVDRWNSPKAEWRGHTGEIITRMEQLLERIKNDE